MENPIVFCSEEINFELEHPESISQWIEAVIQAEAAQLSTISFIFCSDEYLLKINVEYLQHNYFTDVITFPYDDQTVEGDIFISIDRIRDNAQELKISPSNELHRVMVHGVLHLIGYLDKSPEEKSKMTELENKYLSLLSKNYILS